MDSSKESYLMIVTVMMVLLAFIIALFMIMLIYRKRKIEHEREVDILNEKYQKEMLETTLSIQQETMQRIGQEIHDNVGQKLTLAALYTAHLDMATGPGIVQDKVAGIRVLIDESLIDLRSLSRTLTLTDNRTVYLAELLQREADRLHNAGGCNVQLYASGVTVYLNAEKNNMALRITQEFLQNSIKHSSCQSISLYIDYQEETCSLRIVDDGKGFIIDGSVFQGIGLRNMKKRAAMAGATLCLFSEPGKGTELLLTIPLG